MKITLRKKLYFSYSLILILFLGITITNGLIQQRVQKVTATVVATQKIITDAVNLENLMRLADSSVAYYLMANNPQDLDTYHKEAIQNLQNVHTWFSKLKIETKDQDILTNLENAEKEFSDYESSNNQGFQVYQTSIKQSSDKFRLERDMNGVLQAQNIFLQSTLKPTMEDMDKYMNALNKQVSDGQTEASRLQKSANFVNVLVTILAFLISGLIAYFLSQNIKKSIMGLSQAASRIANGDLSGNIKVRTKDEFGELTKVFNKMSADLRELVTKVIDAASALASSSEELSASAEEASASSEEVADTMRQLASGAEEQANSVEEINQVVHQLYSSSKQVANNIDSVNDSSEKAAQAAEKGVNQADNAITKINKIQEISGETGRAVSLLGDKSKQIGQIVDVIKGIAEQTNLLALNAAIEAARAGEQGRGFSVVAEEVRKLAEQSSVSAEQIASLVLDIQKETMRAVQVMEEGKRGVASGVEAVNEAGSAFQTIAVEINTVVKQVQEVLAASDKMAGGTEQVVKLIDNIRAIAGQTAGKTQEVSASTQEQTAVNEAVGKSAEQLAELGEHLMGLIAKFNV